MIKSITYTDQRGKEARLDYMDGGSAYPLSSKREQFAQLLALGRHDAFSAYCEVYEVLPVTQDEINKARRVASQMANETTVLLRVQQLQKPVIRKLRTKLEYGLQKALEQCIVAYDLAYQQGDAKTLLKAIEMQARLVKLLSEDINVNHRYGVLDETSTEVLLGMKRELEVRQQKKSKVRRIEAVKVETVGETPDGPLAAAERVPYGGSIFDSGSKNFDDLIE